MTGTRPSFGKILFIVVYILSFPMLLLALSGDWRWPEGWIFVVWYTGLCFTTIVYLFRHDPALLAERQKPGAANRKGWDAYVFYGIVVGFFAWIVIMPLDAKRYAWSGQVSTWLKLLGGCALLGASFFLFRAHTDNTFLSPLVRIQRERKQHVVSTGVYGFVRHPMYLGAILMFLGVPMLLGSLWGIAIGAAMLLILAGRICGEEKTLTEDLEGYADYKMRVRYRLVPFVW